MLFYFEFEHRRRKAEVSIPRDGGTISVHLLDKELTRHLPEDYVFDVRQNKVDYTLEDRDNARLSELQFVLSKRLQEFMNQ